MSRNGLKHKGLSRMPPYKKWLLNFALITALITTIPYLIGYSSQGDEWHFSGFVFGVEDGNTYLAKMLRGAQGDWLFRTPYTTFEQKGVFAFAPYLVLGKLAKGENQHDQLIVLLHIFRIVGNFMAIFAVYDFSSLFLEKDRTRKFATILVTYGGGFGWLLIALGASKWQGSLPLDFYSPETFGFLGTLGIAHLPWARAFFLWGIRGYLLKGTKIINSNGASCIIGNLNPGILWLATGIAQPITGMLIGVIVVYHLLGLGIWQLICWTKERVADLSGLKNYFIAATKASIIALPLVIYNFIVYIKDPFIQIWTEQSRIQPPHLLHYIIAYGIILPFVIKGFRVIMANPTDNGILLLSWGILAPILLLVPLSYNRRLIEGLWVAFVAIAFISYEKSANRTFRKSFSILLMTLITSIFMISGSFLVSFNPGEPAFSSADKIAAFTFLEKVAEDNDVVLCAYETGNSLPAWAPVTVMIGHRPESAKIQEIAPQIEAFYWQETKELTRIKILEDFNVSYVFLGPAERKFGDWEPENDIILHKIFTQGEYDLFEVVHLKEK